MFPKLRAWHEFLYREHSLGDGLVYIRHPWGSGQDNSPIWDRVMQRIQLTQEMVPEYQRVDRDLVDEADRPSEREYDRYAYLVKLFRDNDYDEARIKKVCPFLVLDVLFNTLLAQSNYDLAEMALLLGEDAAPFEAWAQQTAEGLRNKLWVEEHAIYFDYDLVADELIHAHVAAGFSPLFAGVPTAEQAERICQQLNSYGFCRLNDRCWAVPSYDKEAPGYSPTRYWRGPIWINVNWMLYRGLRRYGLNEYAEHVKQAILELPLRWGFYEYFDPDTGRGHGSDNFSWTAALVLDLLLEEGA